MIKKLKDAEEKNCARITPSLKRAKKRKTLFNAVFFLIVGLLGVEPRSYAPHAQILPLYYSPISHEAILPKRRIIAMLNKKEG